MFGVSTAEYPKELLFLLVPNFSMMAFTSSVEPLRAANLLSGKPLYRWTTATVDGAAVSASNGVALIPDSSIDAASAAPAAIVACAGLEVDRVDDPRLFTWLRREARKGVAVGGVCTGPLLLAKAGLLDGYRCTIHWENVEGFVERFPDLEITATLFEVDRGRFTCSGGTAPLDMMLYLVAQDHGQELALSVAEEMLHSIIRHPHDPQRMSLRYRTGISHPKLLATMAYMEAYLEAPVTREDLAAAVGLSNRQLERLFRKYTGMSPSRYYLGLRLRRARQLLTQTSMPILQVAVACGFTSASHFARCYRAAFGHAPRHERPPTTACATPQSANEVV